MNIKSIFLTSFIFIFCALLLAPMPTKAEVHGLEIFEVDTFEDLVDGMSNGICSAGSFTGGPCSLRAAVSEAFNVNYQDLDLLIRLPYGTYKLTQTDPSLGEDKYFGDLDFLPNAPPGNVRTVTIEGTGDQPSVIDGNRTDRVFEIGENFNIILKNVVITRGVLVANAGMIMKGGGIYQHENSTLELDKVRVTENQVLCLDCASAWGGGIHSFRSKLTIKRSEIDHNFANNGTAIDFLLGDILLIRDSAIHSNGDDERWAIVTRGRLLNIINSTVAGEIQGRNSGVWVQNSTLFIIQDPVESEFYANNIMLYTTDGSRKTLRIKNSILYTQLGYTPNVHAGDNCRIGPGIDVHILGGNVFTDESCPHDTAQSDVIVTNPMHVRLGKLMNNGGRTPTRALLPGSPAVNRRDGLCYILLGDPDNPSSSLLLSDQRGADRDRKCDSGAFEAPPKVHIPAVFK